MNSIDVMGMGSIVIYNVTSAIINSTKKVKQKQICIQIGLSNITPNGKYTFWYFEKDKDRLYDSEILRALKKFYISIRPYIEYWII